MNSNPDNEGGGKPRGARTKQGFSSLAESELLHIAGARAAGQTNLREAAEVTVFLRAAPSSSDLETVVQGIGGKRVRSRQLLNRGQISEVYGADPKDVEAVEKFANDHGLTVSGISPAQRTVRLAGTLGDLAKAFHVQFSQYQSSQGAYRGYSGQVQVPNELAGIVQGVFGLDNKPQVTFHLRKQPATSPHAGLGTTYAPNEVASLYNFPTDADGTGQCIAILEFGGGYSMSDMNAYFQSLGIKTPDIVAVSVGNASNAPAPGPNSPDFEVCLDIEVIGAVASGAQLVVYFAPNTTAGFLRAVNAAIYDTYHNPSIISISWGGPESTWSPLAIKAMNYQFQTAAALGITICVAAGDSGYTDGLPGVRAHVDFPASSPYALACGGTRLDSSGGTRTSESVWNDSSGATGGGISSVFPVPSYQTGINMPPSVNPPYGTGRGVPDVSGDADPVTGYRIRVDGQDVVVGGTSAVAPLWSALLAIINQKIGSRVGFVHSALYQAGPSGGGFNDIVQGNNGKGGYHAGPGWDPCTGLGTPNGTALSDLL